MSPRPIVAGLILLVVGCARNRDGAVQPETPAVPDSVFVEVINDNYYDARIHVLYDGGAPVALGTVPGNQRLAARAIPWQPRPLYAQVALIIGGGTYLSDKIDAAPGAMIQIRVPPNLQTSGFFRRISR